MATVRSSPIVGWRAFFAWALGGGLLALALVGMASNGLLILPPALLLLGLLVAFAPDHRDRWGLLAGVGALLLVIGVLNLDNRSCPEEGWVARSEGGTHSCGGLVPWPWLAAGALVVATAVFLYQRSRPDVSTPDS